MLSIPEKRECPLCNRDFLPDSCLEHCGPTCCRRASCGNAKPLTRNPARKLRKCAVCHRTDARFPWDRFAPCDENCKRVFFATSRVAVGRADVARKWVCQGVWGANPELHRPAGKPRVHIKYCSLRCYYNSEYGHDTRKRDGLRRRNHRYWDGRGSKSAFITERNRAARTAAKQNEQLAPIPNTREGRAVIRQAAERAAEELARESKRVALEARLEAWRKAHPAI